MENMCRFCGACCRHVAIEIDTPEDTDDYEDIYWYLLHENIKVFVTEKDDDEADERPDEDHDDDPEEQRYDDAEDDMTNQQEDDIIEESWFIEFKTPCTQLDENNMCRLHSSDRKPKICTSYDASECVNSEGESEELYSFSTAEDFLRYLKKEKGIDLKP